MAAQSHEAVDRWAAARTLALADLQRAWDAAAADTAPSCDAPAAQSALGQAVDAARANHCSWGDIANVLGIARGNAYQRYRTKPLKPKLHTPPL
jgi:hypothetical protein